MTILGLFVVLGFGSVDFHRLAPAAWVKPLPLLAGGMVIFLAYEGFELITNTAMDYHAGGRNRADQGDRYQNVRWAPPGGTYSASS